MASRCNRTDAGMEWKYDGLRACHELVAEDDSIAARIYESEKQKTVRPFRAKSLISVFFYGERRLNTVARRNKEWVTHQRSFKNKAERESYVACRKQEIARFIRRRVAEGGG